MMTAEPREDQPRIGITRSGVATGNDRANGK